LTAPQFRLLKRLDEAGMDIRLAHGHDRQVARNLEALDCVRKGEEFWWEITDHGRNILDLQREFFEEPHTK
jgi:anti-sigma regulatory factor (Ser/Thr protein kinase)